jgi:hypothetical protein
MRMKRVTQKINMKTVREPFSLRPGELHPPTTAGARLSLPSVLVTGLSGKGR